MQLHQRVFVSQFPCLVEEYLVYFVFNSSLLVINILHTVLVSFSANHRESELAWTFTWPEMSLVAAETVKWTKLIVSLGWVCVVAVRPSALLNCRQLLQILKSKSKHRDYLLATAQSTTRNDYGKKREMDRSVEWQRKLHQFGLRKCACTWWFDAVSSGWWWQFGISMGIFIQKLRSNESGS